VTTAEISRQGKNGLKVIGDMTFSTAPRLYDDSITLLKNEKGKELNIDLTQVAKADSAGLALLLEWLVLVKRKGGRLVVKGMPESMQAIAHLCQIDSTLDALSIKQAKD
jgi:phospholipid transport system transporter-binding protein